LSDHAALEESFAGAIEGAVEDSKEDSGVLAQDLASLVIEGAQDVDVLEHLLDIDWTSLATRLTACLGVGV